jgi:hypothetical protein
MLKRLVVVLGLLFTVAAPALVALQQEPGQTVFVPVSSLPEAEKLPAPPFVISAYALVWLIAMFYIWTVWRKVGKLEGELRTLERRKGTPR